MKGVNGGMSRVYGKTTCWTWQVVFSSHCGSSMALQEERNSCPLDHISTDPDSNFTLSKALGESGLVRHVGAFSVPHLGLKYC